MNRAHSVKKWFGSAFDQLHPDLQTFHINGGTLTGFVSLKYGKGFAGFIGRKLGKKLGLPNDGNHPFTVSTSWQDNSLHWDRTFNNTTRLHSIFVPFGTMKNGYWLEKKEIITLKLTVEIIDSNWHWKTIGFYVGRIPLPQFIFPTLEAYKKVDNSKYKFYVSFSYPLIGQILRYEGDLNPQNYAPIS